MPALLAVIWEGSTGRYEARTSDISIEGCFIDSMGQVTMGEKIAFSIGLRGKDAIEIQAEVVHAIPNMGFGVRFTDISEADRKRLEWLVRAEAHEAKKRGN